MDPISTSILAAFLYDTLKYSGSISVEQIKSGLKGWLIGESLSQKLVIEFEKLGLNNDMSEKAIHNKLSSSETIDRLLKEIKPTQNTTIQNHYGNGDNIAGNKIIHS